MEKQDIEILVIVIISNIILNTIAILFTKYIVPILVDSIFLFI